MKKAYVKPVLVAEPYEMTETVAWCPESQYKTINVYSGAALCVKGNCHLVDTSGGWINQNNGYSYTAIVDGKETTQTMSYWQYAGGNADGTIANNKDVFLFSTGNYACDFLWSDPTESIYVWKSPDEKDRIENNWVSTDKSFSQFFYGNESVSSGDKIHAPGTTLGRFFS